MAGAAPPWHGAIGNLCGPLEPTQCSRSAAAEPYFYDCAGNRIVVAQVDCISESSASSEYRSLCVSGGDGKMTHGPASAVLGGQTSLAMNFNVHNHVLMENSPDFRNCSPTVPYQNWLNEVWYGGWIDQAAFGVSGSCKVTADDVHASPAYGGANSLEAEGCPC